MKKVLVTILFYNERYFPAIAKNLQNNSPQIRQKAANILKRLCANRSTKAKKFVSQDIKANLIAFINNDTTLSANLLWVLAHLQYSDTSQIFTTFVQRDSYAVKVPAAYGLIILGELQHLNILLHALDEKDIEVQARNAFYYLKQHDIISHEKLQNRIAASLLQKLENRKILVKKINDDEFILQFNAKVATEVTSEMVDRLAEMGNTAKKCVPKLVELMNSDIHSRSVIYTLGKIADDSVIIPLMKNLQDKNNRYHEEMYMALGDIGKQPHKIVPFLLERWKLLQQTRLLNVPEQIGIAYALICYDKLEVVKPYVLTNLQLQSNFRRSYTLTLLRCLGKKAAFATVVLREMNKGMRDQPRVQDILQVLEE